MRVLSRESSDSLCDGSNFEALINCGNDCAAEKAEDDTSTNKTNRSDED
jgi:hypothetical protein